MKIKSWSRTWDDKHRQRAQASHAARLGRPVDTHWLFAILVPSDLYVAIYKRVIAVYNKHGVENARALIRQELLKAGHHYIYVRKSTPRKAREKQEEPNLFDANRRFYAKPTF